MLTQKHLNVKVFLYKYLAPLIPYSIPPQSTSAGKVATDYSEKKKTLQKYLYIQNLLDSKGNPIWYAWKGTLTSLVMNVLNELNKHIVNTYRDFVQALLLVRKYEDVILSQINRIPSSKTEITADRSRYPIVFPLFNPIDQLQPLDDTTSLEWEKELNRTFQLSTSYPPDLLKHITDELGFKWTDIRGWRWKEKSDSNYASKFATLISDLNRIEGDLDQDFAGYKSARTGFDSASDLVSQNQTGRLGINRYSVELDSKYLRIFDLSNYFTNLDFNQDLSDGIPNWSISLRDVKEEMITDINGQQLGSPESNYLYESTSLSTSRGTYEGSTPIFTMTDEGKVNHYSSIMRGEMFDFRLSAILQPFDFITVYVYAGENPPNYIVTPNFEQEIESKGYNLEFDGFIKSVSVSRAVGNVDQVSLTGFGVSGLLTLSRVLYSPSFLQHTIYDVSETYGLFDKEKITILSSRFNAQDPLSILQTIMRDVLRLEIDIKKDATSKVSTYTGVNYFDEALLFSENALQRNLYVLPVYLLMQVTKRRNYSIFSLDELSSKSFILKQGIKVQNLSSTGDVKSSEYEPIKKQVVQAYEYERDRKLSQLRSLVDSEKLTTLPYFITTEEDFSNFKAYFITLSNAFANYEPGMKTPMEIISEVRRATFFEFFEYPGKGFVFRQPEYNGYIPKVTTHVLFDDKYPQLTRAGIYVLYSQGCFELTSSNLDVISRTYSSGDYMQILSKQKVGFAVDLGIDLPLNIWSVTNGKLLMKYGLNETDVMTNPNARMMTKVTGSARTSTANEVFKNYSNGMHSFANFILDVHNYGLATGSITCSYDPRIVIGKLFKDNVELRVGYIRSVSKQIGAGKAATVSFNLSFVRNWGGDSNFKSIPRLGDSMQSFEALSDQKFTEQKPIQTKSLDEQINEVMKLTSEKSIKFRVGRIKEIGHTSAISEGPSKVVISSVQVVKG